MRAAVALFCLSPIAALAEPRVVAEVVINNHDATLFDDGTWAFVNPDVAMPDVSAPRCISTPEDRLSFCPDPTLWGNQIVTISDGVEDHALSTLDETLTLVAAVDIAYGHGGDLEFYGENSGGLLGRLAARALGLGAYTDQSFIMDDVVIVLSQFADPETDYSSDTIEVLLENQGLYFDLVSVPTIPGFNDKPADFDHTKARTAALANLHDSIVIDGKSLSAIIQEVQE